MKKNSLKKTTLAALFAALVASGVTAQTYSEADNIKSNRELEYPSLEQKGKFKERCGVIATANNRYYWKKKGLLKGPEDPYDNVYIGEGYHDIRGVSDNGLRKYVVPEMWLMQAPLTGTRGEIPPAELLLSRLANWMALDDNAALKVILDCPKGHSVAVETIIKEENRYLLLFCSWGKKYTIEFPRPVTWSEDTNIVGRIVGGNPKSARRLYSLKTGGEKGPNRVGVFFLDSPQTLLPVEEVKKSYKYMLECASKNEPIYMNKLHPFFSLCVVSDGPFSVIFYSSVEKYDNAFKKYPFLKKYIEDAKRGKSVKKQNTDETVANNLVVVDTPAVKNEGSPATKSNTRTMLFSETCKLKVTEDQFQILVANLKKGGITVIDDRKKQGDK